MSYEYDDENNYRYNNSYDTIEFGNGHPKSSNPRKSRSSSKLMSYTNHPKNKHMHFSHSQEDLVLQREKEIEKFKILQQQQHYDIKKIQQLELQDNYRNSISISPEVYHTSPTSKPQGEAITNPDPNRKFSKLLFLVFLVVTTLSQHCQTK